MTDQEIIDLANELARRFYAAMGYHVKNGYRFDMATHPQEKLAWKQSKIAFELLRDTDIDDALSNLEEN